jgi:hypothetical protein
MSENFDDYNAENGNEENMPTIDFTCREGEPLQLVRLVGNTGRFEIVESTFEYLKRFDGGIAVCSIVGKYRTGKSFLMNKLLDLEKEQGFTVSPTVDACTKVGYFFSKDLGFLAVLDLWIFFY